MNLVIAKKKNEKFVHNPPQFQFDVSIQTKTIWLAVVIEADNNWIQCTLLHYAHANAAAAVAVAV